MQCWSKTQKRQKCGIKRTKNWLSRILEVFSVFNTRFQNCNFPIKYAYNMEHFEFAQEKCIHVLDLYNGKTHIKFQGNIIILDCTRAEKAKLTTSLLKRIFGTSDCSRQNKWHFWNPHIGKTGQDKYVSEIQFLF